MFKLEEVPIKQRKAGRYRVNLSDDGYLLASGIERAKSEQWHRQRVDLPALPVGSRGRLVRT